MKIIKREFDSEESIFHEVFEIQELNEYLETHRERKGNTLLTLDTLINSMKFEFDGYRNLTIFFEDEAHIHINNEFLDAFLKIMEEIIKERKLNPQKKVNIKIIKVSDKTKVSEAHRGSR